MSNVGGKKSDKRTIKLLRHVEAVKRREILNIF
jgi:hypothetical protein